MTRTNVTAVKKSENFRQNVGRVSPTEFITFEGIVRVGCWSAFGCGPAKELERKVKTEERM